MDFGDFSSVSESVYRQEAISHRKRSLAASQAGKTITHCIECGEEIPLERQFAVPGTPFCRACAEVHEKKLTE